MWAEQAARDLGARLDWQPFELHPETPPEGAPKPFPPEQWPAVRARLVTLAEQVGVPIDPPQRNVNSRCALEIGELVRERAGDEASGRFHQALSRAFFAEGADIGDLGVIAAHAEREGVSTSEVSAAWEARRYSTAIDRSMRAALRAGVSGVPAFAWAGQPAIAGMREPAHLVALLR